MTAVSVPCASLTGLPFEGNSLWGVRRGSERLSRGAQHFDVQIPDESDNFDLLREATGHEANVRRVRRLLAERGVDRDPLVEPDLGPGMVMVEERAVEVDEPHGGPGRKSESPRERDI
jgi:hypothetical protein